MDEVVYVLLPPKGPPLWPAGPTKHGLYLGCFRWCLRPEIDALTPCG